MRHVVLALAFIVAAMAPPSAYAAWAVTQFKVYEGTPVDAPNWQIQEEGQDEPKMNPAIVAEIEKFLSDAATAYSNMGFPDPTAGGAFDSILKDRHGKKYVRVYLYTSKYSNAPLAWYSGGRGCSSPATDRRIININEKRYAGASRISDENYHTLAHEIVHAIQKVSAYINPGMCGLSQWFSEGTADALSYYIVRKLRNLKFQQEMKNNEFLKVFGGRQYSKALLNPPDGVATAYATSSFWRHLAEMAWSSANGKRHPGSAPTQENWDYLVSFYKSKFPYRSTPASEITWINQLMQKNPLIHADMPTVYARFVASFGDIINTRIGPLGIVPKASEREPRWLKRVFDGCPFVGTVGSKNKPPIYQRKIAPNAAACFFTKVAPSERGKTLRIQVQGKDKALLQQLRIGMLDGSFTGAPSFGSSKSGTQMHIARWDFPVIQNASMTFIVSNMAMQPALTRQQTPSFHLSVGTYHQSLGGGAAGPVPPPPIQGPQQPVSKKPAKAPKKTRRQLFEQQQKSAIEKPEQNLGQVTKAERRDYDRANACSDIERRLNRCDAKLKVTLVLSAIDVKYNQMHVTDGGQLNLMMSGDSVRLSRLLDSALEGMDGSKITLELPPIEYGFSGEINNARIEVSKANGGSKDYVSYGPTVWEGRRAYHRPPNGKVVIHEFLPTILRGHFSADLIDEANAGPDDAPIVARTIEGEFVVSAPWQDDEDNFEVDEDFFALVRQQEMLLQTPFATPAIRDQVSTLGAPPRGVCESGLSSEQIEAMGFPIGCSTDVRKPPIVLKPKCRCSCASEPEETQIPACKTACRKAWSQCAAAAEIPDDLDQQAALYRSLLLSKKLPKKMVSPMVEAFRRAPLFQREAMLRDAQN